MEKVFFVFFFVLVLTFPLFAKDGDQELLSRTSGIVWNDNCEKNGSCDLIKIEYVLEDYSVEANGRVYYGTKRVLWYETKTVSSLEDYVFVQFIRGRMFSSREDNGGKIQIDFDIYRTGFYDLNLFSYGDWIIDSVDTDPAYFSFEDSPSASSRHYRYRWNEDRYSTFLEEARYYGNEKPAFPELYIIDVTRVSVDGGVAKNIDAEFRTCIYKSKDVPSTAKPNDVDFAPPIACMEWGSKIIYNHTLKRFIFN